jgi:hypothetical protein
MSPILQILTSVLAALLAAVLIFRKLMRRPPPHRNNGPWRIDLSLGSERAGLYTKAFTAWNSLFALRSPEAIYFSTNKDSDGERLRRDTTYIITGRDPDSRWWSLTAYRKNRLIPNSLGRYSFSQTTVAREPDGTWKIRLSPVEQPENWLPTGEPEGYMGLVLRFYGPAPKLIREIEGTPLPSVRKEVSA